jgi:hypothetical protein
MPRRDTPYGTFLVALLLGLAIMAELCQYVAFLYGVNIPGGVWLKTTDLPDKVNSISQVRFLKCVGDADNLLITAPIGMPESFIAGMLNRQIGLKGSVVLRMLELQQILNGAKQELLNQGFSAEPPYRLYIDGVLWEFGLVFASTPLPIEDTKSSLLFPSRKNVRAISVIRSQAMLVLKRFSTERGSRIMFGTTVISPWRTLLKSMGVSPECFTSRALGRIESIVSLRTS